MRTPLTPVAALALCCTLTSTAQVTVLTMDTPSVFRKSVEIDDLVVEDKAGHTGLHMRFTCTGKGVVSVSHVFEELQDWTGYDTLHFRLFAESTGGRSHFQVQLYDAANNLLLLRRHLSPAVYGVWQDVGWSFGNARPYQGDSFDLSRVKMIYFTAWQDHYGHSQGDRVSYLIGKVTRERSRTRAGLGVAPAARPPALDGRLDDECWAAAPIAEQFFLRADAGLPRSQTAVRLAWDLEHLYIGVQADSALLDPVQQRLDDFKARALPGQGSLWSDDNLEVFLAPADQPESYVHFAVNARGATYAKKAGDAGVIDGGWQAGCAIHEGFWVAEMAVPWGLLGLTPKAGILLRGNFFRKDAGDVEELSGWSPVEFSHHTPEAFGDLHLLAGLPDVAVRAGSIPRLVLGENLLTLTATGITGGALAVRADLSQDGKLASERQTLTVPAGETRQVSLPVTLALPGTVELNYSVHDVRTDALYLRTPHVRFATAATARILIRAPGSAAVFLNGDALRETGDGQYAAFLQQGANVIGIETEHPVELVIDDGAIEIGDMSGWRQSAVASDGWLTAGFDDAQWRLAAALDGEPVDPAAGRFFRRVLVTGHTRVRALGAPDDIHIAGGLAQHLPLLVSSPLPRPLREATLVLEVPEGLEWVRWDGKRNPDPLGTYKGETAAEHGRGRAGLTRHEFSWETMLPMAAGADERQFTAAVVLRDTGVKPARREQVRIWLEAEGGSVLELPRDISVTVLPPVEAKRPAKLQMHLWHAFSAGRYSPVELEALMDTWWAAGFTHYVERTTMHEVYNPRLRQRGFNIIAEWIRPPGWSNLRTATTRFIGYDGKPSPYIALCPTWLIGEGRAAAVDAVAEYIARATVLPDSFIWDLEMGPRGVCYCPRCLAAFAARHKVVLELDTDRVQKDWSHEAPIAGYAAQWEDFWCRQWAEVASVFNDGFKKVNSAGSMQVYSAYQTPANRTRYYADWELVGPHVDTAVAGYGWSRKIVADTVAALDGKPLVGGVAYYTPPRRNDLKLEYLKLVLAGCSGVMLYQWGPMDGLDYTRVAEAVSLMAEFEDFFLDGKLTDGLVSGPPGPNTSAMVHDGRLLVLVVNETAEPRVHRLSVERAAGEFREYPSGRTVPAESLADRQGLEIRIPARDVFVIAGRISKG